MNGLSQGSKEPSEGDPRLARAMEEYQALLAAGGKPDHAELLARYPEVAGALADCLAGLDFLHAAGPNLSRPAADSAPSGGLDAGTPLGDFRIVREVGRGGMGVVYEAEQLSLRRRVALKVLPFAGTLDPKQLQRFQNEAQAAACLHHGNIVPVYFVGCERGVHYYAMQFIDGQTLAELIHQLQQPAAPGPGGVDERTTAHPPQGAAGLAAATEPAARQTTWASSGSGRGREFYRQVAELGVQAAEALDHAHQAGVVHRDVKPGNLLLDGQGKLWVTDFGLAHVQSGASLTVTGDLVGTLRYMSPEQALAKRVVIDHRTDVYSLGATLYELLTLRPAFGGTDRQELLRQIAFEEPQAPRRIDRAIPAELETIVLKALEKNPADRYATAQEMADDLRRFLDDQPIRARRPSWRQVAAKWARRHRGVVWAGAVMLAVVLVLGGGFGVWRMQLRAVAQAQASQALKEADDYQAEGKWPEARLAARRAEPLLSAGLLNEGLRRRVHEKVADLAMVDRLEQIRLQKAASTKEDHFDGAQADPAYAQAFRDYGVDVMALSAEEAAGRIRARGICVELAAALDDWAAVCRGTRDKADTTWKDLLGLARAADPDDLRNRLRDALERRDAQALIRLAAAGGIAELPPSTLWLLGHALGQTGAIEDAVAVLRQGQQRHPGNFWVNHELAHWLAHKGPAHQEEVVCYKIVAVALRPLSPGAHNNLGNALRHKGQLDAAIAEHRTALRLQPNDASFHNNLGVALRDKGKLDAAIAEYREALRLNKDYPAAHNNLGAALFDKGQVDEAIAECREAIRLNKDYPAAHINLGNALRHKGKLEEAIAEYREAIRLNKDYPVAHINLGATLSDKGQLDEAIAEFREAIRCKKDYAEAHCNLGLALMQKGQFQQAVEELRLGHQLGSKNPRWSSHSVLWLRNAERLADLDTRLPALLKGQQQPKDAGERLALARLCQLHKQLFVAAARWYGEAFTAQPSLAGDLAGGHRYNAACAAALAGCGQGKDATDLGAEERARLRRQALDWLRADLDAWRRVLEKGPEQARPVVVKQMQHWQQDSDFAGVRGPQALAKLPAAERGAWQRLWADVADMLARSQPQAIREKGPDGK
jgi:serine/threonine protein kinase/Flp pilus assembly protein TadD